ncbi:hypothetical protein [Tessaracoccus flavus]|uniref:Uncharacterized protein n=1 Tax=Tessaracoccus flavus TaxID=1610493 RepID=A0A1Q2CHZ2_9ACTN|nr:hypothetical protein [Tessaracoccus flavus]AQP45732.1 hypothetical protein RPIT_13705 [Tessaracoccus flavus]SDZ12685.1 hypothetical protein SAMN05428934_11158 [Tessaracoccus flavus]
MKTLSSDTGVADLIAVYSMRELLLRRRRHLTVRIASTHPELTIATPRGDIALELTGGQWLITGPSGRGVLVEQDPGECASAVVALVDATTAPRLDATG